MLDEQGCQVGDFPGGKAGSEDGLGEEGVECLGGKLDYLARLMGEEPHLYLCHDADGFRRAGFRDELKIIALNDAG